MVAGGGFEPPTFGLCDLTQLSMRVGLYLHPRGMLAIQSLRLPPPFRGRGSVLPCRSREVGSTVPQTSRSYFLANVSRANNTPTDLETAFRRGCTEMWRAQGTVLFRRGDEAKGMFIFLSETVSLDFGVYARQQMERP